MKKPTKGRYLPFLIGLVLVAILVIAAIWAGPARIRGNFIPSYVNVTYKPFFEHTFDSNFTPINENLKMIGAYPGIDTRTVGNGCGVMGYSGIQETVLCQRFQDTNGIVLTPAFINDWKFGAPDLERYLLTHGWEKRDKQSITKLFDNPREARWINYSKGSEKANCHLYIHYEGRPKPTTPLSGDNKFYTTESCYRSVDFFGGY